MTHPSIIVAPVLLALFRHRADRDREADPAAVELGERQQA